MVQERGSDRPRAGERYSILSGPEEKVGEEMAVRDQLVGKGKSDITRLTGMEWNGLNTLRIPSRIGSNV
jgi:hypothetical protein